MIEPMLDEPETAELRLLHERAYARGGDLTAGDLRRLRELEAKKRGVDALPVLEESAPVAGPADVSTTSTDPWDESPVPLAESDDEEPDGPETPAAAPATRRRWLAAVAAAAILIVGLGAGWMLWGQQRDAISLTAEQRGWLDELTAEDEYDAGSAVAVGEQDGVVAWIATKDAGVQTCVLLSNGVQTSAQCQPTENASATGVWGELSVESAEADGAVDVTSASVLFTADLRPAVAMNSYQNSGVSSPAYSDEEQVIADALIEHGYSESSFWIAGYFEEHPIWFANAMGAQAETCLIYTTAADAIVEACSPWEEMEEGLTLTVDEGDRTIDMTMASPENGPQYVTVTVQPLQTTTGDTDAAEIEIDDKTGDTSG